MNGIRGSATSLLGLAALVASTSLALAASGGSFDDTGAYVASFHSSMQATLVAFGILTVLMAVLVGAVRQAWLPRLLAVLLMASAGLAALYLPAIAQVATTPDGNVIGTSTGSTVVTLPYGEYVAGIQAGLTTLLTLIATAVLAYLPVPLRWAVNLYGVDKLVKDAVGFAVAATPGASRDAKLDIDVGSKVLARALQKAVDDGAPRLIKAAGGIEGLQEKILATMNIHPDVTAKEVVAATPGTLSVKG